MQWTNGEKVKESSFNEGWMNVHDEAKSGDGLPSSTKIWWGKWMGQLWDSREICVIQVKTDGKAWFITKLDIFSTQHFIMQFGQENWEHPVHFHSPDGLSNYHVFLHLKKSISLPVLWQWWLFCQERSLKVCSFCKDKINFVYQIGTYYLDMHCTLYRVMWWVKKLMKLFYRYFEVKKVAFGMICVLFSTRYSPSVWID